MAHSFNFHNVPQAYHEMIWKVKINGIEEESRNGPVISLSEPIAITISEPRQRVLFDPVRNANPFFHLMESIWMLAGGQDVEWLTQFNRRMSDFAEADGIQRGAYGFRWRYHFGFDQLLWAVRELKRAPDSRRIVLSMWDPGFDTVGAPERTKDLPCNTHTYLRSDGKSLHQTVCSRSNDLIWGLLGANVVHFTILQEVLARAIGLDVGKYHILSNNVHIYKNLENFGEITRTNFTYNPYKDRVEPMPIIFEDLRNFLSDCQSFVAGTVESIKNPWLQNVAHPIYMAWQDRNDGQNLIEDLKLIMATDWRLACFEWLVRKGKLEADTVII